ncbi:MAG: hypothetical protein KIC74_12340, partial [Neisseria sp.]|nr:hypothetical protein [Neisseria sp.]
GGVGRRSSEKWLPPESMGKWGGCVSWFWGLPFGGTDCVFRRPVWIRGRLKTMGQTIGEI